MSYDISKFFIAPNQRIIEEISANHFTMHHHLRMHVVDGDIGA